MNCYQHHESSIVSTCNECGRGLCKICTEKYARPVCDFCNLNLAKTGQKIIIRNILLTLVFAYIGFTFNPRPENIGLSLLERVVFAYFLAGIPWGWSALNKITSNVFLFMPIIGWIIYFFVKLILSCFVGIVAFPWKIYSTIKDWKTIRVIKAVANLSKNNT